MAYDNNAARKGQAINLAVHTAIARGEENNPRYIYKMFVYYSHLAEVMQGSDSDLIQQAVDSSDFDAVMKTLKETLK